MEDMGLSTGLDVPAASEAIAGFYIYDEGAGFNRHFDKAWIENAEHHVEEYDGTHTCQKTDSNRDASEFHCKDRIDTFHTC
ncbi:hypothetical protein JTE90_015959 [Oedothorax gibbosus]|uniref:Uncharacterized protein n=1 Tax=Oedothorax gibbosus TaxID=931172 RepID=A0AAV6TRE2_9ARAC|nr:hypothetical protein JTE90_005360 [Oedothorax gibbosus]KAG8177558.1 hypothetical protein JTE90_015959 [Oedothorax gibbosus]